MPTAVIEREDIQALVRAGFGKLKGSRLLLLKVRDPAAARAWLGTVEPLSIAGLDQARRTGEDVKRVLQIAISAHGLRALGLPGQVLESFPADFQSGLTGDPGRSRRLGDVGPNAPETWRWGAPGHEPHILLMLYADCDDIEAFAREVVGGAGMGFEMLDPHLDCGEPGVEPFGFADGISQPVMDWDGKRRAGGDADQDYTNEINAGEVLLGYQNEYNLIGDRPLVPVDLPGADLLPSSIDDPDLNDLGRNGSFLVLRTLKQDYEGFWGWCEAAAGALRKQELAEAVVGRKKNGHPLDGLPRTDIRGVEDGELDGFTYDSDPEGHVCPFGGHIRRANPRMGDIPGGRKGLLHYLRVTLGFWGTIKDDSIAPSRYHRILRRGRPYGAKGHEQGLHFIALNANLTRQFEFVQGAWLANPNFATLADEADPLTGSREPYGGVRTDAFTRPREAGPNTRYEGLPRFVQVVGGGYFFLPGLRALKYIARAAG